MPAIRTAPAPSHSSSPALNAQSSSTGNGNDVPISPDDLGCGVVTVDKDTNNTFRWPGSRYFITYYQLGKAPFNLVQVLCESTIQDRTVVDTWGASEETLEDGGRRWHLFIRFPKRLLLKGAALFDIVWTDDDGIRHQFHPRVRVVGDKDVSKHEMRVWHYISRQNTYMGPWMHPHIAAPDASLAKRDKVYAVAMAAETKEDCLRTITRFAAGDAKRYRNAIKANVDREYAVTPPVYEPKYRDFPNLTAAMRGWLEKEFVSRDHHRPKTLVLYGPTGLGKTEWARSLGSHNYQCSTFKLSDFDESKDYIVLDNFDFKRFPFYKGWLGANEEFHFSVRNSKAVRVRWGKPCIWVSRVDPRTVRCQHQDVAYLEVNCVFVNLTTPLYAPTLAGSST